MTPPDRVPLKPSSFEWMDFWWFGPTIYWLVVEPTPLKNISENGNLPQIGVKIKNIWNRHPDLSEAWESSKWFTTMKYPPCKRSQPVCPEKWLVGIRSFPFGTLPIFRGELAVSFREGNRLPQKSDPFATRSCRISSASHIIFSLRVVKNFGRVFSWNMAFLARMYVSPWNLTRNQKMNHQMIQVPNFGCTVPYEALFLIPYREWHQNQLGNLARIGVGKNTTLLEVIYVSKHELNFWAI